jgi:hypothetical protein
VKATIDTMVKTVVAALATLRSWNCEWPWASRTLSSESTLSLVSSETTVGQAS